MKRGEYKSLTSEEYAAKLSGEKKDDREEKGDA